MCKIFVYFLETEAAIESIEDDLKELFNSETRSSDVTEKQIDVVFEEDLRMFLSRSGKRLRMNVKFEELLNKKLRDIGFKCILKCKWNWFNSIGLWSGVYNCAGNKKSEFKLNVKCLEPPTVSVKWTHVCDHEHRPLPNKQIRGQERQLFAFKIAAMGVGSCWSDSIIKADSLNQTLKGMFLFCAKIENYLFKSWYLTKR